MYFYNQLLKKASMIKLTHHEMPVNKTLHHRTIEILTVLTLLMAIPFNS